MYQQCWAQIIDFQKSNSNNTHMLFYDILKHDRQSSLFATMRCIIVCCLYNITTRRVCISRVHWNMIISCIRVKTVYMVRQSAAEKLVRDVLLYTSISTVNCTDQTGPWNGNVAEITLLSSLLNLKLRAEYTYYIMVLYSIDKTRFPRKMGKYNIYIWAITKRPLEVRANNTEGSSTSFV